VQDPADGHILRPHWPAATSPVDQFGLALGKPGMALVMDQAEIALADHQRALGGTTRPPSTMRPMIGSVSIGARL